MFYLKETLLHCEVKWDLIHHNKVEFWFVSVAIVAFSATECAFPLPKDLLRLSQVTMLISTIANALVNIVNVTTLIDYVTNMTLNFSGHNCCIEYLGPNKTHAGDVVGKSW